jgi:hypothetical protein
MADRGILLPRSEGQCLRWVNRRTTHFEHNESAYPSIADIRGDGVDGSEVREADVIAHLLLLRREKLLGRPPDQVDELSNHR